MAKNYFDRANDIERKYQLEGIFEYVFGTYCNEGGDAYNTKDFENFIVENESWIDEVRDFYTNEK